MARVGFSPVVVGTVVVVVGSSRTGAAAAASAWPIRISVPAGSPACSAVRVTWTAVTAARTSRASALSFSSIPPSSVTRNPQSPSAKRPFGAGVTGWPRTTRLVTVEPATSADVVALARAATLSKVISPLKSATVSTSFTACARGVAVG